MINRRKKTPARQARGKLKWYTSGALVIVVTLLLLGYIGFVQASVAFREGGGELNVFQASFAVRMFSAFLLVLVFALFWFFFAIQDYRMAFDNLVEQLQSTQPDEQPVVAADAPELFAGERRGTWQTADELILIENSVNVMLRENKTQAAQLDIQRSMLRENVLVQLMEGWIKDSPLVAEMCHSLGIELENQSLQVVVFALDDRLLQMSSTLDVPVLSDEQQQHAYQVLCQVLEQMLADLLAISVVQIEGMLACLVAPLSGENLDDKQTATDLTSSIKLALEMVRSLASVNLYAALSGVHRGFAGVRQAFSESIEDLQYARLIGTTGDLCLRGAGVLTDENSAQSDAKWAKQEFVLLNCLNSKDFRNARIIVSEMLSDSALGQIASLDLIRYRMLGLSRVIVEELGKVAPTAAGSAYFDSDTLRERILAAKSLPELRHSVAEALDSLDHQDMARKKQVTYTRMLDVAGYVNDNFKDQNLSVAAIAQHFDFNPSYLSRSFKQHMGIGLTDYLQRTRVREARELMDKNAELNLSKAAELVGFSNPLTMNRAFRKHEGTTAGRLRKPRDS